MDFPLENVLWLPRWQSGNLAGAAAGKSWGRVMSPARIWMQPMYTQQFKTLYQAAFIAMYLKHTLVHVCVTTWHRDANVLHCAELYWSPDVSYTLTY